MQTTYPSSIVGLNVAIVGMGPRGLSVLERLVAQIRQGFGPRPIHIWTIDPDEHGAGRIWSTDQSEWLLMNTIIGQITIYAEEDGAPSMGPSLYEWLQARPDGQYAHLGKNDYVPRTVYGQYLCDAYCQIKENLPEGIYIHEIHNLVSAIRSYEGRYQLTFQYSQESLLVDKVVLATGHPNNLLSPAEEVFQQHVNAHPHLAYIPSDSAASMKLSTIKSSDVVALRGMGLTFYDILTTLTCGRGGTFTQEEDGRYRYHASGEEPRIIAGSRSGLPFLARGKNQKKPEETYQAVFLTPSVLEDLRQRALEQRGSPMLDFATEIRPLIDLEIQLVYFKQTIRARCGQEAVHEFACQFIHEATDPLGRERVLKKFDLQDTAPHALEQLARPFADQHFVSSEDFCQHLLAYLCQDVAQAQLGNLDSPLKAAFDVPRDIRLMICTAVNFSGLLPSSQREFERHYVPSCALVSTGPPLFRVCQLMALIEAGIVEVVGPDMQVICDVQQQCFTVFSPQVTGSVRQATVLIEARLPDPCLPKNASPLFQQLFADGLISEYVNSDPTSEDRLRTGGVAVTPAPYRVIDRLGHVNPNFYAIGIPTEHTLWFTQVGSSRPGCETQFSREANAIASDIVQHSSDQRHSLRRKATWQSLR